MPCPHWSKRHNECLVLHQLSSPEEEEGLEVEEIDKFRLEYCLHGAAFAACPTFKRQLIEQAKAY